MVARSIVSLLMATVCLLLPPRSTSAADLPAKPPAAGTDAALMGQARKLHSEGAAHFRAGEYAKAYAALAAAWGIKKHYRIAGPLGACELELGQYRDAAEHLRFFLDRFPADGDPTDRRETETLFLQAASKVVQLIVKITPPDGTLRINGNTAKAGQLGFYNSGAFKIEVTREGYIDVQQNRILDAGTSHTIEVTLAATSVTQPPRPSDVDGRLIAGIAAGVGALVGFGVGIGATVVADNRSSDVMAQQAIVDAAGGCTRPSAPEACMVLLDAAQARDTALDISDGTFIAGGVLAASSIGLLLWWALDPDTGDVQLVPSASSNTASLSIMGTW